MKKKLLFFIESLEVGGAEKSLVTLLLSADLKNYDVDLMMLKKGTFLIDIPSNVNVIFVKELHPSLFKRAQYFFLKKAHHRNLHASNYFWKVFQNDFPNITTEYDIAIAYGQGLATYFVAEKIQAPKKIAWVNTDYKAAGYKEHFDVGFYKKFSAIVAVSEFVKESLQNIFQNLPKSTEIVLLPDIIDPEEIIAKSTEPFSDLPSDKTHIVSVGRLVQPKGFLKAIEAAKLLKERELQFTWWIIGEGSERNKLELLSEKLDLRNEVKLLGMKENPYPYMKAADLYVQTSLFEGLGLSLIEAKILGKPVVTTNFTTASQIIKHGETGLICEMNAESIAENLEKLILDENMRQRLATSDAEYYNDCKEKSLQEFYILIGASILDH